MSCDLPADRRVILITGCSSGIGRCAVEVLLRAGHGVLATARRAEDVAALEALVGPAGERGLALPLDVTNAATIDAAVERALAHFGRLDALVNNAGYGQIGAIEDLDTEAWRRQFETNVFGAAACVRAVVPVMRRQGGGRIVQVSSIVAHLTTPLMGAYCASKFALESLSSALRMEMAGSGIFVSVIEPGPVDTGFRKKVRELFAGMPPGSGHPLRTLYRGLERWWETEATRNPATPEQVAGQIQRAIEARRPRVRYRIGWQARVAPRARALLPDRWMEKLLRDGLEKLGRG